MLDIRLALKSIQSFIEMTYLPNHCKWAHMYTRLPSIPVPRANRTGSVPRSLPCKINWWNMHSGSSDLVPRSELRLLAFQDDTSSRLKGSCSGLMPPHVALVCLCASHAGVEGLLWQRVQVLQALYFKHWDKKIIFKNLRKIKFEINLKNWKYWISAKISQRLGIWHQCSHLVQLNGLFLSHRLHLCVGRHALECEIQVLDYRPLLCGFGSGGKYWRDSSYMYAESRFGKCH